MEVDSQAQAALDDALRLAAEGAYAEALERHEWFHEHALEHDPAMRGVRVSFALSYWVKLGGKYPPALESLRKIRDANGEAVRLPGSSDELFADLVAINRALGEDAVTMQLFREMELAWPELARKRFRYVRDRAFEMDLELFIKHTSDFVAYAERLAERCEDRIRFESVPSLVAHFETPAFAADLKKRTERMRRDCVTSILKLAGLAAAAGKDAEARKIARVVVDASKMEGQGRE